MSAEFQIIVRCDECSIEERVITSSIIVARYMLQQHHGWSHIRGYSHSNDKDYCLKCTKEKELKNNENSLRKIF